ncbi:sensor histidine kinase [Porphyromonas levii]|uniref:sensor histidine kinase n=1 Tax=Porphyromonas levii TaxID=28114 RepID=UPI001B8C840F|nr:HAMP domain-containing sensor histidine kinase [Porphyromonas levii]MBR8713875.1 Adaptive-response sensory-kinase SasA [Porphyromonas levii]MBR8715874.1 Adaptive-response sensory-kinase SasA [Porphyromonas levii]MBR8728419.1 Adaptive-response sensory-kinase SasA [Porphyromonas levii]MBR8729609.1 Adaptive-response sensory-kinase SasA [Porphyromonas levii]MBR8736744.1 Adaptive-response sensory-kinase SasA [Porphyromonas levii]
MKKWTLWLIVGVMALAFIGLLTLQLNYVDTVNRFRNEQFDSKVRQALSSVSQDAERAELSRLISEKLGFSDASLFSFDNLSSTAQTDTMRFNLDQLPQDPFRLGKGTVSDNRVQSISRQLMEAITNRYDEVREMVIQMAMESVRDNTPLPIYERITEQELDVLLDYYLTNNGITLPYIYEVEDKNHRVHYSSGLIPTDQGASTYSQVIFSYDNPSRMYFVRVFFPTKDQEIRSSLTFIVPSAVFTALLFVIFVLTMASLFRQKKLEEMRKDFVNNMTHELKTPVSTIMVASQMLSADSMEASEERRQKWTSSIMAEGQRLELLIDKVLQMSFFDKDKVKLKLKEIDMEELLLNVTNIFSLKVESFEGEINVDLEAEEALVEGDEMHLTNIIFNLLDNAVKYRDPHRPPILTVGTSSDSKNIKVFIQDNGLGMKKEHAKKVFDRFYRVPTGNRHDVKGYGLGLAYVYHMVQIHHGQISVDSELGKGTKFVITLPLLKEK